ncbi:MAG: aspartate-semialdehyde dehydrogenase [Planctomycetota bacterium]|jgi:aspartate-semialdehyde dehydrogenase|nr:aspartate-semialdehyde dehydrogenase [Planctomycetota bacterium]
MSSPRTVALVGATGVVGKEFLRILEERNFEADQWRMVASSRSAGQTLTFRGSSIQIEDLATFDPSGVDLAFFSAGGDRSRDFIPQFVSSGAVVIDNSSAFRLDPEVPLIIPEVNPEAMTSHGGILANPNCSTIIALVALAPIHRAVGIRRLIVSTYQAVSGTGQAALDELEAQTQAWARGESPPEPSVYPHPIAFNCLPMVDRFDPEGHSTEELKMRDESRKILQAPELRVSTTCVRVPVRRSHAESIVLETESPLSPDQAREILRSSPGVVVVDEPQADRYPHPLATSGQDNVQVGRIRVSPVFQHGLALWVSGDQLRKGAATNAVQIAELLAL